MTNVLQKTNYNEHLLIRGANNKEIALWLKKRGKFSVPGLRSLARSMSDNPEKYRDLFKMLEPYHVK